MSKIKIVECKICGKKHNERIIIDKPNNPNAKEWNICSIECLVCHKWFGNKDLEIYGITDEELLRAIELSNKIWNNAFKSDKKYFEKDGNKVIDLDWEEEIDSNE